MSFGENIFGEVPFGESATTTPVVVPPVTGTSGGVDLLIQQTGVRIPSGVITESVHFNAVDPSDNSRLLTGLTDFTVAQKKGSAAAAAMTTPIITEDPLFPGTYALLCNQDMGLSSGKDVESKLFRITHASLREITLRLEIFRPKITVGNTLTVPSSGIIPLPIIPAGWITQIGIAGDIFPQHFNKLKIQVTTGKLQLTDDSWTDGLSVFGFDDEGVNHLSIQDIRKRIPAELSLGGNMMSDQREIAGSADTNSRFAQAVDGNTKCIVGVGSNQTTIVTSSCNPPGVAGNPDQFKGQWIKFPKGTTTPELKNVSVEITASTGAVNPVFTVPGLSVAPAENDYFVII